MTVELKWVPSMEASDHRKARWREVKTYTVEPDHFLMVSPVAETCARPEPAPVAPVEIRRLGWDNDGDGTISNHPNGEFVLYEDHVAAMCSQPALRMTEELGDALDWLEMLAAGRENDGPAWHKTVADARRSAAAVRAQAAGVKVELPKVRKMLLLVARDTVDWLAAMTKLDAAEGRK